MLSLVEINYVEDTVVKTTLALIAAGLLVINTTAMTAFAASETNLISITYDQPKNPAQTRIFEYVKERNVLERLKKFLSPFRLPMPVEFLMTGCGGDASVDYGEGRITICYEFVDGLFENMPDKTTPAGIAPIDTVVGPFFDTVLHEFAHALFDMFYTPIFGREEDAADQLAAYLYLQLGEAEARRLILGTAYNYLVVETNDADSAQSAKEFIEDSAETHSLPAQRAYSLLCMAFGANPKLFADLVSKGYLPKERAEICEEEYEQVQQAYADLIEPHIDLDLANDIFDRSWLRKVTREK
jgi:hypothetical protein